MKKVIVYYSMTGNIEYVSKKVSKYLDADLIKLIPVKEYPNKGFKKFYFGGKSALMKETPKLEKYSFDSNKYDHVILALPVWASSITPPLRTFIVENKKELKNKKLSIIVSYSGSGATNVINKTKELLEIDNFQEELLLIDPKDKQSEEKDNLIKEFCEKIKKC